MSKRVLTPMQQAFLDALAGEAKGDIRAAMRMAGYSDNVQFRDVVKPLAAEIEELARDILARNSVKAVVSMVDTLDQPMRPGGMNALAVAKELLDRVGVVKKDVQSTTIQADTLYILPPKDVKVAPTGESE